MSDAVAAIYRYPVKSMGGELLDAAQLGAQGIPGDRAWAVRDEKLGGIRGGKRFPELMRCSARYSEAPPTTGSAPATVSLPDDSTWLIDDPDLPARLSELVGNPVTVWPLLPAEMLEHYERGAPVLGDMEAELRRIFGRQDDEPLPDLGSFPEELMRFESPPGTYFDAFPLLVMTSRSLAHLASQASEHRFDVRRFRPNLLIETDDGQPFPERSWVGHRLAIGDAELEIVMDCPRCVMTTHGFAELPKDPGIMRTLVREADGNLGVYARVTTPGTVRRGDRVTLVS